MMTDDAILMALVGCHGIFSVEKHK